MDEIKLSIIVPVYNEASCIGPFLDQTIPVLEKIANRYEIIFVNDGSKDDSLDLLLARQKINSAIKVVNLSRNFGKDIALTAGLDVSVGGAVVPIDVDLQDPPEIIERLFDKYNEGYDMVVAVRKNRGSDHWIKRTTANIFYALIAKLSDIRIPQNAGDFRIADRKIVDVLKQMPERSRFMKGLFSWMGFRCTEIYYSRNERASGGTKWNYWALWNFALDGIFSFSTVPLRIWSYIGFCFAMGSFAYMFFVVIKTLIFGVVEPGYASIVSIILFLGGLNLIGIGVLGEYVGRLFAESKRRPLYIINEIYEADGKKEQTVLRTD